MMPLTIPGKVSKLVTIRSYMIQLAACNNLPSGTVIKCSYVTSKAGQVALLLVNITDRNIRIHHPLLATKRYEVGLHHTISHREENSIKTRLQRIVTPEVEGSLQTNQMEAEVKAKLSEKESNSHLPSFGLCPDTSKGYNFKN